MASTPIAQATVPAASVHRTSFACPHCGAHATQFWYDICLDALKPGSTPRLGSVDEARELEVMATEQSEPTKKAAYTRAADYVRRLATGEVFFDGELKHKRPLPALANAFVSKCYTCKNVAIWMHDRLFYPSVLTVPGPNADLTDDVKADYEEARRILDLSPRGAAALLRLAIEKICIGLGAAGNTIDQRISDLVSKGLPKEVQQALDTVRVIGNEAVHPGAMDLRDDRDTATSLFGLVNFIAEDRISRPKQIQALYELVPSAKRDAIDKRNEKAIAGALASNSRSDP